MLLQMRNFTRSWVAYALLFVLAAMFVLFLGNGQSVLSALQFAGSSNVADVAGRSISPAQLTRELELALRAQRNQGQNLSQQDAIRAGLHLRLLESIIGRTAIGAYAERIGVTASDLQVAHRIREIPAVLNPVTRAFDETAYDTFLSQMRYSRAEFEQDIRGELTAGMLMEALASGLRAPSSFGALAFAYERETRVVSIAEAPASATGAIAAPTAAQLQTFYEESQAQLQTPEYRALTLVYARPQDFIARVNVPEARLREEFEGRRAALTQPERRTYVRIAAASEAQANDAAARLARGESAASVATALGLQTTRGENQARAEVPDARVAAAVFAMPAGAAPRVVRSELAPWAVVRVEAVTPAAEPNFAAMREELRQAIAADEAGELLNTAVGAFEDARAGGASITEAARQSGLPVIAVAGVNADGRSQDGQPVAELAGQADLLAAAFQTPEGEASDFMPAGDADVVVSVDRVIPSSVRPFAQVRDQLERAWLSRERTRRLRQLGEQVVAAVNGGQSLAAAARAQRLNLVVASRPIDRGNAAQIPARGLAAQIFAAPEGAAVTDMRSDGQALLVAVVEHINRADPAAAPQDVEALRAQFQQGLTGSFGESLQAEIVARARPKRNEALIARLYPRGDVAAEEGQ